MSGTNPGTEGGGGGGGDNAPPRGGGIARRSNSVRRLSTEAAEMALHGGIDLDELQEMDAEMDRIEEEQRGGSPSPPGGETGDEEEGDRAGGSGTVDMGVRAESSESLTMQEAKSVENTAAAPRRSSEEEGGRTSRKSSKESLKASRRTSKRLSYCSFVSAANSSSGGGSVYSTGSFNESNDLQVMVGTLKGSSDDEDRGSVEPPRRDSAGGLGPRRASTKSIDLGGFSANDLDHDSDDGDSLEGATVGAVRRRGVVTPSSPRRAQKRDSPPRYDPEAISKVIRVDSRGSDLADDAEEEAWREVRRMERKISGAGGPGGRPSRRASDYAVGNDADADFEKEWGDMVAVSSVGVGGGKHRLKLACAVLVFVAAAAAVAVGTYAGVGRIYANGPPTPTAEVSEEDRVEGALPTPTPPEPPSDLAEICSAEAVSSSAAAERRCEDACTRAECCFVDPETNYALSCIEEYEEICQEYESHCSVLDQVVESDR